MERRKVLSIQEVISINTDFYQTLQKDAQNIVAGEKEKMTQRRMLFTLDYSEFCDLFISFGTYCLFQRNQHQGFIIDDNNKFLIEQLYYYATNSSYFEGNLNKGIMLQGRYGCGKTILMETYSLLHNHIVQRSGLRLPLFTFIKSVNLQELIIKQSIQSFVQKPLIIDEFGRESKTVQNYGNVSRPISELLSLRSDIGVVTHGTTNFTLETLASDEFYGGMIGDRLKVMFNFITLQGESRRK